MNHDSIIIGIAGASGSGKSLLAHTIVNELGSEQVIVISEDSYYKSLEHLDFEERSKINFDHPDAFDHALLHHHLIALKAGGIVEVPQYDHTLHKRLDSVHVLGQHKVTVLEGILLFTDPHLREMMDILIFIDTPLDICLLRRLKRDMQERGRTFESVLEQYQSTVRPMYLQFIEPSKRYADLIVPRGGANRIAIDLIQAKLRELIP